ncbi:MAG: hypothetical protein NTW47_00555, partial [Proteobacteria bacterium]|nr:hypothetical protein [Pseudomonadota bacterium]
RFKSLSLVYFSSAFICVHRRLKLALSQRLNHVHPYIPGAAGHQYRHSGIPAPNFPNSTVEAPAAAHAQVRKIPQTATPFRIGFLSAHSWKL